MFNLTAHELHELYYDRPTSYREALDRLRVRLNISCLFEEHRQLMKQQQYMLHWEVPGFKRGPIRPRTNWRSTVNKDLLRMGITWDEVEVAAQNRSEWRRGLAQCIHLDVG